MEDPCGIQSIHSRDPGWVDPCCIQCTPGIQARWIPIHSRDPLERIGWSRDPPSLDPLSVLDAAGIHLAWIPGALGISSWISKMRHFDLKSFIRVRLTCAYTLTILIISKLQLRLLILRILTKTLMSKTKLFIHIHFVTSLISSEC